jgi:hypothetical protein
MTPGAKNTATVPPVAANPGAPGGAHSIHTHHKNHRFYLRKSAPICVPNPKIVIRQCPVTH